MERFVVCISEYHWTACEFDDRLQNYQVQ